MITANDPRHGRRSGYAAGCRQDCCTVATRRHQKNYRLRAMASGGSTTVDARRAQAAVADLAQRMSYSAMAKALGTGHSYLTAIESGRIRRISPAREAAILRLRARGYTPTDTSHVNPRGARRRLQALHALGYTWVALATETGIGLTTIKDVSRGEWPVVEARHDAAIRDAYDRLSMQLPTGDTRHKMAAITKARQASRRYGWAPPLAWDDDAIDDPDATPAGMDEPTGSDTARERARRIDVLTDLADMGENVTTACQHLDVDRDSLWKWCKDHDLLDTYARLAARERVRDNQHTKTRGAA